jgi:hypothetical protein
VRSVLPRALCGPRFGQLPGRCTQRGLGALRKPPQFTKLPISLLLASDQASRRTAREDATDGAIPREMEGPSLKRRALVAALGGAAVAWRWRGRSLQMRSSQQSCRPSGSWAKARLRPRAKGSLFLYNGYASSVGSIVFAVAGDPVGNSLVESLARPGATLPASRSRIPIS